MIGRDQRYRNRGFGSDLLVDALARITRASDEIGISVVMLDVFDCGDPARVQLRKALYEGFGFTPVPSRPLRLFLPTATERRLLAESD
jgi:ribosomal protein S18 acetylase RimI-like enzyme